MVLVRYITLYQNIIFHFNTSGASIRTVEGLTTSEGNKITKNHMKIAIFDDQTCVIGSNNWSKSAKKENLEIIAKFTSKEIINQCVEKFDFVWDDSQNLIV